MGVVWWKLNLSLSHFLGKVEVEKMADDSAQLVTAYNNLKEHQRELPKTADQVDQYITDLKAVLSSTWMH